MALFNFVSTFPECDQTGAAYSAMEYTNVIIAVLGVEVSAPHSVPANFYPKFTLVLSFFCSLSMWLINFNDRSIVIPKYFGVKLWFSFTPLTEHWVHCLLLYCLDGIHIPLSYLDSVLAAIYTIIFLRSLGHFLKLFLLLPYLCMCVLWQYHLKSGIFD